MIPDMTKNVFRHGFILKDTARKKYRYFIKDSTGEQEHLKMKKVIPGVAIIRWELVIISLLKKRNGRR